MRCISALFSALAKDSMKRLSVIVVALSLLVCPIYGQIQQPNRPGTEEEEPRDYQSNQQTISVVLVAKGTIENPSIVPIYVEIPSNALIQAVTMEAKNWFDPDSAYQLCPEIGGCPIGWCSWVGKYTVTDSNNRRRITATFKNWSHNWDRYVRVTVVWSLNANVGKANEAHPKTQ